MSEASICQHRIEQLTLPIQPRDTIGHRIHRAWKLLNEVNKPYGVKFTLGRVKKLWYGEVNEPKAWEWRAIERTYEAHLDGFERHLDEELARLKERRRLREHRERQFELEIAS